MKNGFDISNTLMPYMTLMVQFLEGAATMKQIMSANILLLPVLSIQLSSSLLSRYVEADMSDSKIHLKFLWHLR